jgi:hypothetical protein
MNTVPQPRRLVGEFCAIALLAASLQACDAASGQ